MKVLISCILLLSILDAQFSNSKYPKVYCNVCNLSLKEKISSFVCRDNHVRIKKNKFEYDKNGKIYLPETVSATSNVFILKDEEIEQTILSKQKMNKTHGSDKISSDMLIKDAGEDVITFVNEIYTSYLIGFAGISILIYSNNNLIEISGTGELKKPPSYYVGSGIMVVSFVQQILSYIKLKSAGKKLKKAGERLKNN